ncbi:helix-turn-helix domain-containing protein, partial [Croceicoccus gelatinilyticus]|uniref:helix-turn-helix domain-containing protein n=1 Tax=Croceicoccus gelatinilyticus TaxID=2835536 RepID=UPI001BD02EEE
MQVLTYVYRLKPTRAQHGALRRILDDQRYLYNAALHERIDAWRRGVSVGMNDQTKSLTSIRGFDESYGGVPYNLSKWTLKRLDDAMKGFFRRAKTKGKAGFPRFRPASRWDSFGFHQIGGLRIRDGRLLFSSGV